MQLSFFYRIIILFAAFWLFIFASKPIIKKQQIEYKTYILDTVKSKIDWNSVHYGLMKFKEGTILLEKELPVKAKFTIDMTSITNTDIDNELLQGTLQNVLKSIEFFNTKVYPESYFESHSIVKISENEYKISGDFIIFDIGLCHTFEGSIKIKNDSLYFNTKTIVLDRTNWGIFYGSAKNPKPKEEEEGFIVTDTILLDAHIQAYLKPE
ncbi:MAG: YceI family protein [Bacteroidota bacterium]